MNAELDQLDARLASANDKAKSDLEAHMTALRGKRDQMLFKLKASFSAELRLFEKQIDELQARAISAEVKAHAIITDQLAAMRAKVSEAKEELRRLTADDRAKVNRGMNDLREGLRKAADAFH